ncbi:MAG: TlpA family protein disulfide reductase [Actinomycetota bacterium]|nr:TlpA family protein disulfide reductase [Actinomycetota bacterium]
MPREAAFPAGPRPLRRRLRLLAPAILLAFLGCTGGSVNSVTGVTAVSKPFPRVAGASVHPDGGHIDTADFRGQPMVVNFWATWCGPCLREQPILQELWQRYKDRGVAFLGVDQRDDPAKAQGQLKDLGVTYPNISDLDGAYAADFGFFGLPDTYVVDRTGMIRYQVIGRIRDPAELAVLIDRMLAPSA